jgi:hypothetical protein
MNKLTKSTEKSKTNHFLLSYHYNTITNGIVVIIGAVLLTITLVPPENPYALSYSFWYADFRY